MRRFILASVSISLCVIPASVPGAGPQQVVTPPKARYYMDVSTQTGMPAGKIGVGSMMGMAFGGSSKEYKSLGLYLGSSLDAGGKPQADHFMPGGAKLGKSVPLISPETAPSEETPVGFQRPKGRLLIYWGCGGTARKGQPVVIDFARVAAGQLPPNLWSVRVPRDRRPTVAASKSYGDWPNSKSNKSVSSGASVLGGHRVASSYLPSDINFTLEQDFMPGVALRSTSIAGATSLAWNNVAGATGYYAWTVASDGTDGGDIVWWSSSDSREFGGGLTEFLSPASVDTLVRQSVVMPPTKTSCAIPAEVKKAAGFGVMMLYAYGPEQNFIYPERPADPKIAWNQDWAVKVRYRSLSFEIMADGMNNANANCKRAGGGGLMGGILGAAIGNGKKNDGCN
jgi:hypothetical protein